MTKSNIIKKTAFVCAFSLMLGSVGMVPYTNSVVLADTTPTIEKTYVSNIYVEEICEQVYDEGESFDPESIDVSVEITRVLTDGTYKTDEVYVPYKNSEIIISDKISTVSGYWVANVDKLTVDDRKVTVSIYIGDDKYDKDIEIVVDPSERDTGNVKNVPYYTVKKIKAKVNIKKHVLKFKWKKCKSKPDYYEYIFKRKSKTIKTGKVSRNKVKFKKLKRTKCKKHTFMVRGVKKDNGCTFYGSWRKFKLKTAI